MELIDCFKDELRYIHELATKRANKNPAIGDFLNRAENDADVAFLFEHFAFLMAKLRLQVDDAFPEVTQNLLSRVWPTPIRPVPSSSILQFQPKSAEMYRLAKGSQVAAALGERQAIYQLARDTVVAPYKVNQVHLRNTPTHCLMTLTIEWFGGVTKQNEWQTRPLSLFLSPDTGTAGMLLLWLQQYLSSVSVIGNGKTIALSPQVVNTFIPDKDRLVLPLEITLFWRLQLLQEYFHLPHVNDFVSLDISAELDFIALDDRQSFELVLEFDRPLVTDKVLNHSTAFLANCAPIINLYRSVPQIFDFNDGQSTYCCETEPHNNIYQIDKVYSILESAQQKTRGESIDYLPISQFSANHYAHQQLYYRCELADDVRGQAQTNLTFIDNRGERVVNFNQRAFFCEMVLTNGQAVNDLGLGDVCLPTLDIANNLNFSNITVPTQEIPGLGQSDRHWPIISYLSLSPIFLKDLSGIKQLLTNLNYHRHGNMPLLQISELQLKGLIALEASEIDWLWDKGLIKRGLSLILTLDPDCFQDPGEMYRFSFILANVLPFCLTSNNFLMLKVLNVHTQERWSFRPILGGREQI